MNIDFHYHLASDVDRHHRGSDLPPGCILAQDAQENGRYLGVARSNGIACGLFAMPGSSDWSRIIDLVAEGSALAYQHIELIGISNLRQVDPILEASEYRRTPVILHLSRHDGDMFSEVDARASLDYILGRYPELSVIISHCGGENVASVLELARLCPRVILDTSRLSETSARSGCSDAAWLFSQITETVRSTQVLYGSDSCWSGAQRKGGELDSIYDLVDADYLADILEHNGSSILRGMVLDSAIQ